MAIVNYQQPQQPKQTISDRFRNLGNTVGNRIDSFFCRTIGLGCNQAPPAFTAQQRPQSSIVPGAGGDQSKLLFAALGIGALILITRK